MIIAVAAPAFADDLPYSQDAVDAAIAVIDAIGEVDSSDKCVVRIKYAEKFLAAHAVVTNYGICVEARLKFDALTVIDGMVPYVIWLIDQIGDEIYFR